MNEEALIKEYFKNKSKRQIQQLFKRFYRERPELKEFCQQILIEIPEYEKIENIVYCIVLDEKLKTCDNCGKFLKYSVPKERRFCSCSCAQSNAETKQKMSNSIHEIYNDKEKYFTMIEKRKQTNIAKYGVDHPWKSEKVKEKINKTNVERYGTKNIFNNEKIKEKRKKSYLEHYGVDHPWKSKEIQTKISTIVLNELEKNNFSETDLKNKIILEINSYIIESTGRRPIIIPIVLDIEKGD